MITLKDIKISKNRIPVQNAIWLRPVGGLSFKIYYPHGGDWSEVPIDGTSSETIKEINDTIESIQEEVDTLESNLQKLSSETDRRIRNLSLKMSLYDNIYKVEIPRINKRLTDLEDNMGYVLDHLPEYDTVYLNKTFSNLSYGTTRATPETFKSYGFTTQVMKAIESGECTQASITRSNDTIVVYPLEASGTVASGTLNMRIAPPPMSFGDIYTITVEVSTHGGEEIYTTYIIQKSPASF